jgi:hypothetical protein
MVYSENNTKSMYKLRGQNAVFFLMLQHLVHRVITVPYRVNQPRRQTGNVARLPVHLFSTDDNAAGSGLLETRSQNISCLSTAVDRRQCQRSAIHSTPNRMAGVRFPAGGRYFSFVHNVQTNSGAHLPSRQWEPGAPSLSIKRAEREADHSPPSNAEVNNGRNIPPMLN